MKFFISKLFFTLLFLYLNLQFIGVEYYWLLIIFLSVYIYEGVFVRLDTISEIYQLQKANIISFVISIGICFFNNNINLRILILFFVINFLILPLYMFIIKKIFLSKIGGLKEKIVILYDIDGLDKIKSWIGSNSGYEIITKFKIDKLNENVLNDLDKLLDKYNFDSIFISTKLSISRLVYLIDYVQLKTKKVFIFPFSYFPFYNIDVISSFNAQNILFGIKNNLYITSNIYLKNIMDIFLSIIILILTLPILGIIYFMIKIVYKTNPIFSQIRVGKDGKAFKIYKFKTMVDNGDEILEKYLKNNPKAQEELKIYKKLKFDPRVTKIGKFLRKTSLDELPQIFNVLKGDMTLIGPRPYLFSEINDMGKYFKYYIKVKPGITGLWQVSGRNEIDFKNRIMLDVWYIKNWSFKIDMMILLKTIYIVLVRKGSY